MSVASILKSAAPDQSPGSLAGLAIVIDDEATLACDIASRTGMLVHLLIADETRLNAGRKLVQDRDLGGRVVVHSRQADGRLPHPDRFANLVVADLDTPSNAALTIAELRRVLALRGSIQVRRRGEWTTERSAPHGRLDGWFAHWYDASGNCVSQDREAGFPRIVQWQHGPAFEDGTADGKIMRIADGRAIYIDNTSGDIVCRDAGNGLLLWRRSVGLDQRSDVSIATGEVFLWHDTAANAHDPKKRAEAGPLVALSLASGEMMRSYDRGLKAGAAKPVVLSQLDRQVNELPTPWFVVTDDHVVQAYGPDLAVLDRKSGDRRWAKTIEGATWFSPIVSDGLVLAAEAVEPGKRQRNDGAEEVRAVAAFDLNTGEPVWRNEAVHPERKLHDAKTGPFTDRASFKTMSAADGLLLLHISSYQFREGGSIAALDLRTGRELWRRSFDPKELYTQGSQRPVIRKGEVVVLDGTGVYRFDAQSGKPIGEPVTRPKDLKRTGRVNGACTASRATVDWLMANAWLYVGPDGAPMVQHGARAGCGQGAVPAHGLVYMTPTPCDCGDYVRGYLAMSPTIPGKRIADDKRLTRGIDAPDALSNDAFWPTFLGNPHRTSSNSTMLSREMKVQWSTQVVSLPDSALDNDRRNSERYLGALSAPVIGEDRIVVAAPETHQVIALDEATGRKLWTFNAGGKVDSPPTLARGMAFFGCDDGAIYALRLSDGALVWRFFAAPTDGLALRHGHVASAFPIPGAVTVLDGAVIAVAGEHSDLGGLHVWSLDVKTGQPRAHRILDASAPPAIANNITVTDADGKGLWIVSPPGGSYGAGGAYHLSADLKDLPISADGPKPAMSFDRQGTRMRFRTERGRGGSTHGWKGAMRANVFHRLQGHRLAVQGNEGFGLLDPDNPTRTAVWSVKGTAKDTPTRWELSPQQLDNVESLSSLIVAGDVLLIGGGKRDGSGGKLFAIDPQTGKIRQQFDLPARVTECGIAAALGSVIVSCEDGTVVKLK